MPAEVAVDYIARHIREIKVGGSFVFLHKIKKLFRKIIFFILVIIPILPLILIIRIIRPYKIIRFGVLGGNRIGNLAGNTEIYLCNRDAGIFGEKTYDIFVNIKYNYSPIVRGKGSAIFLHLTNKKYKPTEGCIAILKKDFLKILPFISKNTKISIN